MTCEEEQTTKEDLNHFVGVEIIDTTSLHESRSRERESVLKCFNCNVKGHHFRNCPEERMAPHLEQLLIKEASMKKAEENMDHTFRQCFICQKTGHISKECPEY